MTHTTQLCIFDHDCNNIIYPWRKIPSRDSLVRSCSTSYLLGGHTSCFSYTYLSVRSATHTSTQGDDSYTLEDEPSLTLWEMAFWEGCCCDYTSAQHDPMSILKSISPTTRPRHASVKFSMKDRKPCSRRCHLTISPSRHLAISPSNRARAS